MMKKFAGALAVALVTSMAMPEQIEHRGIWLHPEQFKMPEVCELFVERMAKANINVAYALVWYWGGTAYYRSDLYPMPADIPKGYDPLGYLIEKAHACGIQIHAWFVNGSYGVSHLGNVFSKHPDWRLQPAPGRFAWWYDFGKLEVREFQTQVMLEVLRRYPVDGLHFDYIRYNGPQLCFCDHCVKEFRGLYGHDLRPLARDAFPLAARISGNPLDKPTSARILAKVSGGPAAIAINEFGRGQVLILNWHAQREPLPAVETVLTRFLEKNGIKPGSTVYLHQPRATTDKYGRSLIEENLRWMVNLGYKPKILSDEELTKLPKEGALILANSYIIPGETVERLAQFVEDGGALIVVDGPVFSISNPKLQRLLGFASTAPYYSGFHTLEAAAENALIPIGGKPISWEEMERILSDWARYRMDGVSELVRQVYTNAKKIRQDVAISAAVFYRIASARNVFQDWVRWLKEEFIDYVLPMAYVMTDRELTDALDEYRTIDPNLSRIIPGLSLYMRDEGGKAIPRPPELVLRQVEICRKYGARGVNFFSLAYLSDDIIGSLVNEPFREPAKPYVPVRGR